MGPHVGPMNFAIWDEPVLTRLQGTNFGQILIKMRNRSRKCRLQSGCHIYIYMFFMIIIIPCSFCSWNDVIENGRQAKFHGTANIKYWWALKACSRVIHSPMGYNPLLGLSWTKYEANRTCPAFERTELTAPEGIVGTADSRSAVLCAVLSKIKEIWINALCTVT